MLSTERAKFRVKNLLNVDADGFAFSLGANVGATYQVNEHNKFGITVIARILKWRVTSRKEE